jgi:phytoene dehydrogenase-like protein
MSEYDYVFVGGGINALVAAAMLGKKRRTTLVLERNAMIGGCLRTEEVTSPGFVHDVMATTLVLFRTSPAYQALGKDLAVRGFAFADTNLPTAVLRPDGSSVILSMDRARNVKTFDALADGDGRAFAAEMDVLAADSPFLVALLAARYGHLESPRRSHARFGAEVRAAWLNGLAMRLRPRGAISRPPTARTRSATFGHLGCCTPASDPRVRIRRRW